MGREIVWAGEMSGGIMSRMKCRILLQAVISRIRVMQTAKTVTIHCSEGSVLEKLPFRIEVI